MNTILVVTADDARRARLLRSLGAFSVFEAASDAEALKTLRLVDIDLVLRDSTGRTGTLAGFVGSVRELAPSTLTVAVGRRSDDEAVADFDVADTATPREFEAVLQRALEKQRLVREVNALRTRPQPAPPATVSAADAAWDGAVLTRVLKGFTRVLAAGFDLRRLLEMFLDAIGELVRPTRLAVLLPGPGGDDFRIVAHRGLAPQIVQSVRLDPTEGLARWLAAQGRPASLSDLGESETARELKLLQGVVAVPLLAHGELAAIVVLGQPIFGGAYARRDLETLFDLATHLATVIRDIALHEQLEREKEFTERILSHMSSGVITIGRDQRVSILTRRAEEILDLPAHTVVGQDLRLLPSPLGDMLFETLTSGRALPRTEIQLALRRLWLEVSTYLVRDADGGPLGAVLVFE
ncbi:MAG TPA: GAF domain-containing protein, partial [Methylomirabilota bacterium]|nr:GAF domain-containing protein [Methylomirabilota bacterium]